MASALPGEPELVRISELARRSEVPTSTVKHYIREGLIPRAAHRTSKNMGYYDARLVPRIKTIKAIQSTRYLPLRVIKRVLDEAGDLHDPAAEGVARALDRLASNEVRTREEILATGVTDREIVWLVDNGVLLPTIEDGTEYFTGDDLSLVELLMQAREAGITAEMIPAQVLVGYAQALHTLVRFEWQVFQRGLENAPPEDVTRVAEVATALSERLVVLMRRKMLLPTLRELTETLASSGAEPTEGSGA